MSGDLDQPEGATAPATVMGAAGTPLPQAASAGPAVASAARRHIPGMDADELAAWLAERGQPRFRATQVTEWVFARGATDFGAMTNLPLALRDELRGTADVYRSRLVREALSTDGTRKLVLEWPDATAVETVWIPAADRNTACLSSQVGCPVGCRFCASGMEGVERNLTAGEIVEQALRVRDLIRAAPPAPQAGANAHPTPLGPPAPPPRLSNIVMMGMGEPLANYREVVRAIRILNAPWGLGIGARKITVSTVGLPKQIRQLAHEDLQLNLALSLHAPDDALRRELIPWGKGVPIAELIAACEYYFERTGREITLEYVLLDGVNMAREHARGLARIARRLRANVNLLRYNPVPGAPYERPSAEAAFTFQAELRAAGVNAHVRTSRGKDAAAACGQLRRVNATRGEHGPSARAT